MCNLPKLETCGFDLLTEIFGSLQSTYIVLKMFRQTKHSKYFMTKQSGS